MTTIRLLNEEEALSALPDLCDVLADCVEGGASLGFMSPYRPENAIPFWQDVATAVGHGELFLLVAEDEQARVIGTVQVGLATKPNQPHRGDLMKLLVHRRARGLGLSRLLMMAAEEVASKAGRTLLVLDTATGEPAERIYERLGWSRAGVIPNYALFPDGRYCDTTIFYKQLGEPLAVDPKNV
ncbi:MULTISPECIES: GNAT family N-acetyltransferase [Alphaproteobacteria]|uniref:N-acetyltransferase n=2 Tax=Alphaproteobacteria TaxID=28211 RepID=A0A512HEI3_9HYPH|nr:MULTISPECIES: GNAT family N-acetyltransferase [Alphaproteobacteria]GEO83760.1 N-acetyltransferase [Ciceribacter naphthalenivorans]GLR24088.1 N-acetyltransferase [Ciceribacter naphthalenivorans]GLT06944.1 N-acetyltransferase [Sphingomonas psychrolutea]